MDFLTNDLGETASYCRRPVVWIGSSTGFVPYDRTLPGGEVVTEEVPGRGKLILTTVKGKGTTPRQHETDEYAVDVDDPEFAGCRTLLMHNLTDATQPEPYKVTTGAVRKCTCKHGKCRRAEECKHLSGADWLWAEGAVATALPEVDPRILEAFREEVEEMVGAAVGPAPGTEAWYAETDPATGEPRWLSRAYDRAAG